MTEADARFDPYCRRCRRLVALRERVSAEHPDYHAAPVPAFGAQRHRLLIVGLAPGMHGANRTGRPFTGDYAGLLLYRVLHAVGLATRPVSESAADGLRLKRTRITNAVKCLPPGNSPKGAEVAACNDFLAAELAGLPRGGVVLALGGVAHRAVLRALGLRQVAYPFGHGSDHALPGGERLVSSYHCSRYNTQTGRLTEAGFLQVMRHAARAAGLPGR